MEEVDAVAAPVRRVQGGEEGVGGSEARLGRARRARRVGAQDGGAGVGKARTGRVRVVVDGVTVLWGLQVVGTVRGR